MKIMKATQDKLVFVAGIQITARRRGDGCTGILCRGSEPGRFYRTPNERKPAWLQVEILGCGRRDPLRTKVFIRKE